MLSTMPAMDEAAKAYLDYLDKEMTIMGILSTFCIAAAALVIDRISSADGRFFFARLATAHPIQIYVGSGLLMAAGLCFYLQRSRLAHFYGSIVMSVAQPTLTGWTTERWLQEVYTWAAWIRYRIGFIFLTLTPIVFGFAIGATIYPQQPYLWRTESVVIILMVLVMLVHNTVYFTFRYSECPWNCFHWRHFIKDWMKRSEPNNVGRTIDRLTRASGHIQKFPHS